MRRPTSENSVENGDGNTQVGHNSGSITVGFTVQEYQAGLEKAVAEKAADLERAHIAERAVLQKQLDESKAKLADVESSYKERVQELENAKRLLARFANQISSEKREAAYRALDAGDSTLAQALLKELSQSARNRREDAAKEEAEIELELGKLAESEIRWTDAAIHYARAAQLNPCIDTLEKASEFARTSGDYPTALLFSKSLLDQARTESRQENLRLALNQHAGNLMALGQFKDAEELFREAIEDIRATNGQRNPTYATLLSNLGLICHNQERYAEGEKFLRQAMEIERANLGEGHKVSAIMLNNLAMVVQGQKRYAEAEELYGQAMKITRVTFGEKHPNYAVELNNLAGVIQDQRRYTEAEDLYRQALEINRTTIGENHPEYAGSLNNLALTLKFQERFGEAEEFYLQTLNIIRSKLPPNHPYIKGVEHNLAICRAQKS